MHSSQFLHYYVLNRPHNVIKDFQLDYHRNRDVWFKLSGYFWVVYINLRTFIEMWKSAWHLEMFVSVSGICSAVGKVNILCLKVQPLLQNGFQIVFFLSSILFYSSVCICSLSGSMLPWHQCKCCSWLCHMYGRTRLSRDAPRLTCLRSTVARGLWWSVCLWSK